MSLDPWLLLRFGGLVKTGAVLLLGTLSFFWGANLPKSWWLWCLGPLLTSWAMPGLDMSGHVLISGPLTSSACALGLA